MTRTHALAAATTAAVLALALAACSDDADPAPSDSTSNSSDTKASPSAAPLKDRSSQIFETVQEPQVRDTAEGSVTLGIGVSDDAQVIFEVTDVTASPEAALLQYQITAQQATERLGMAGRFWYDQPTLQVPGADKKLQPVTGSVPAGDTKKAEERCVCTAVRYAGPDPRSQTTLYPPLPKHATEVEVTLPGLDPVTVPISR